MAGFGGTVKLKGESEYRKAIQNITKDLKSMSLELKNQATEFSKSNKSLSTSTNEQKKLTTSLENQKSAINQAKTTLSQYSVELTRQKTVHNELTKAYRNAVQELEKIRQECGETSDEYKAQEKAVDDLGDELAESTQKMNESQQAMKRLKNEIRDAENVAQSTGNAIDGLGDEVEEAANEAEKASRGGFSAFGLVLANLATTLIQNVISGLKELAKETLEVGMAFEASMSKVQAVSGASAADMELLTDKAKEMGSNTKFSASEAAEAFNYMAMAGWDTESMLGGIEGVMNLAAASGEDLATTSDIVTDSLTAMGYSAEDAGRLADIMAAASSNANTNVSMMGATFKYAAPVAGALGYSMEDLAIATSLMANAGIKGEQAGTSLRSVLSRLSAPPAECAKAMDALGISITNADGTMKPLSEVLDDLRVKFDGLSESQQAEYAKAIAGTEAMSGLLAIVNAAPEDYEKLTNAVNNSSGAAQEMADIMMNNAEGSMTLLKSKIEGIQIELYEKLQPAIEGVISFLDKLADGFQWILDNGATISSVIAGVASTVGTLVAFNTAITVMEKGWKALKVVTLAQAAAAKVAAAAQALFNGAMVAGPIGLVIAAVVGLVAAFVTLWNKSEAFREFWIGLWESIKAVAGAVAEWFSETWSAVAEWFKGVWETVSTVFSDVWNRIKELFSTLAAWFNENVFQPIMSFFEPVITFFEEAWYNIKGLAEGCWILIKTVWGVVSDWFNDNVIEPVKDFFSDLWDKVSGFAKDTWKSIKGVWNTVSGWFNDKIISPVKNFFKGMWDGVKSGASRAWEGIKSVFSPVVNWFKDKFSKAWQAVKNVFSTGGKVFDGIKEGIVSVFKTVVNAIIRGINKVIAVPFNAINKMLKKIKNVSVAGVKPFSGLIKEFTVPEIPQLAKGGILKRGQVGLLEGNGTEAVVPLEQNTQWTRGVAAQIAERLDGNTGRTESMDYNRVVSAFKDALSQMKVELDDDEVGRFINKTVTRLVYT